MRRWPWPVSWPAGITANVVSPGVILDPGVREMLETRARAAGDERSWADLAPEVVTDYAPHPVGRVGRPEDVAAAVAFRAGPLADYVPVRRCESTARSPRASTPSLIGADAHAHHVNLYRLSVR